MHFVIWGIGAFHRIFRFLSFMGHTRVSFSFSFFPPFFPVEGITEGMPLYRRRRTGKKMEVVFL